LEKEAECKAKIKTAENELEKKVIAKYPTLSIDEIKTLVVDRKWMDELQTRVMSEVDRTSQTLAGRIKELAERYSETLPEIEAETKTLTVKVDENLAQMGFKI
jgi:type I restriction enzyme M protein